MSFLSGLSAKPLHLIFSKIKRRKAQRLIVTPFFFDNQKVEKNKKKMRAE